MPRRFLSVMLAILLCGIGYVAGTLGAHSEKQPPPTGVQRPIAGEQVKPPPISVQQPLAREPVSIGREPSRRPPIATPLPLAPAPPPPHDAPSVAAPRALSPLQAFRFAGIGPAGGLRLARVRPGSLPAALGLQTGDELLTINQWRITDPEQALLAYSRLRHADRLELAINRNGTQTALIYFIR